MEAEAVRCGRLGSRHCHCAVPAVATDAAPRCVVPEYGHARINRTLLRHGHCPPDSLHHHDIRCAAWSLALPESLRRRRFLRLVPACLGMARGTWIYPTFFLVLCFFLLQKM